MKVVVVKLPNQLRISGGAIFSQDFFIRSRYGFFLCQKKFEKILWNLEWTCISMTNIKVER